MTAKSLIGHKDVVDNHNNNNNSNNNNNHHQMSSRQNHDDKVKMQSVEDEFPADRFSLVYVMFILLGIGTLLPWNVFINAKEYFEDYKLNTNQSANADYRINFMNYLGLAGQCPNMIMTAFNAFYQPIRLQHITGNATVRVVFVILIEICVCSLTIVMAMLDTSEYPALFFKITIISACVLSSCTGIYQSNVFGTAALLPMRYSSALVLGTNVCGALISIVNIICKALATKNPKLTAQLYFAFAVLLLLLCLISMLLLPRSHFYNSHASASIRQQAGLLKVMALSSSIASLTQSQLMKCSRIAGSQDLNGTLRIDASRISNVDDDDNDHDLDGNHYFGHDDDHDDEAFEAQGGMCDTISECFGCCCPRKGVSRMEAFKSYWQRYISALRDSWIHCLSVWSIFFCSLSCFPAILSSVRPVQLASISDWFVDIFVFFLFNFGAMLGSLTSQWWQFPGPRWLSVFTWARTLIFIPLFTLCNCFPNNRISGYPVLINNDFAFIAAVLVFAVTSGHFSSLAMMYAPRNLRDSSCAGVAAMLATFFLVFGIFCGISFGGFLFNFIQN